MKNKKNKKNISTFSSIIIVLSFLLVACVPATKNTQSSLTGTWEGLGMQNNGSSWTITLEIPEAIAVGGLGAVITYPSLNCGGVWTLESKTKSSYIFSEEIRYGQEFCIVNGTVTITPDNADSLSYSYSSGDNTATGRLTRKVK